MTRTTSLTVLAAIAATVLFEACSFGSTDSVASTTAAVKTPTTLAAAEAVNRFKAAGLPIGEVITYTAETDPNNQLGRPNGYTSKTNWRDTRLPAPQSPEEFYPADGGAVQVYTAPEDAQSAAKYNETLSAAIQSSEYNFVHGTTLLRVSGQLTPDQANAFDAALVAALGN